MENISRLTAIVCLLLLGFCGCGKGEDQKPDTSLTTIGCANNLRAIDAAKKRWAQDHNAALTDTPTMDDLAPYFRHGVGRCPEGGTYTVGKVSDLSECSIPAHTDYYKAHLMPGMPEGP